MSFLESQETCGLCSVSKKQPRCVLGEAFRSKEEVSVLLFEKNIFITNLNKYYGQTIAIVLENVGLGLEYWSVAESTVIAVLVTL